MLKWNGDTLHNAAGARLAYLTRSRSWTDRWDVHVYVPNGGKAIIDFDWSFNGGKAEAERLARIQLAIAALQESI